MIKSKLFISILFLPVAILLGENEDALIRDLRQSLMASCFHGTVYEHGDAEMEAKIRELVNQGKTKEEVTDYFVDKYGERILAAPVAKGFNLMAWVAPGLVFVIGVIVFANFLRQRSREPAAGPAGPKEVKTPYDDIIERELKEME